MHTCPHLVAHCKKGLIGRRRIRSEAVQQAAGLDGLQTRLDGAPGKDGLRGGVRYIQGGVSTDSTLNGAPGKDGLQGEAGHGRWDEAGCGGAGSAR